MTPKTFKANLAALAFAAAAFTTTLLAGSAPANACVLFRYCPPPWVGAREVTGGTLPSYPQPPALGTRKATGGTLPSFPQSPGSSLRPPTAGGVVFCGYGAACETIPQPSLGARQVTGGTGPIQQPPSLGVHQVGGGTLPSFPQPPSARPGSR